MQSITWTERIFGLLALVVALPLLPFNAATRAQWFPVLCEVFGPGEDFDD